MKTLKEGFFGNIGIGKTGMIETWLKEMGIKNYVINDDDYTIDINGKVNLGGKNIIELPEYIQFGKVKGEFNISDNPITTLRGCPKEACRYFYCIDCKKIKTLEGTPKKVEGGFYCTGCENLKSLKGAPQEVSENFNCSRCNNLTSLEGAPEKVGGSFYCYDCKNLTSLEGAPKKVSGYFYADNCGKEFTIADVKKYCNVKKHIYV